ncbi:MAG: hypothetical protein ACOYOU_03930 [Kiritimatiellia bacterium]
MGMPKAVRVILKVLAVLAVLLVVLVVVLVLFLGPIIKTAAEKIGPKVLGVPVTVEKVSVHVFSGSFGLKGLRVGNPPDKGYSADPAFALREMRVAIKLSSLPGKGPIEVKEVTILEPKVSYEIVSSESNIDAMLKNMQGSKSPEGVEVKPKSESLEKPEAKPADKKASRKVIIDHFEFRGGELSYRAAITLHKAIKLPLPPIVADDIGKSSNGTSVEEAVKRIFLEVTSCVGKAVVSATDAIGSGVKAGADAVKDGAKGVKDALKSLF